MLVTLLLSASLLPQAATATQPPDLTLPPETASTVVILEGRGSQVYTCSAGKGTYSWTFTAPEALLYNLATGKPAGHHDAGPTWTLDDGSSIRGTVIETKAADTPTDVPWLLLRAVPANQTQGALATVTYVRRYNTHGGVAPAFGCNAQLLGRSVRVPYTATYAFYTVPR